MPDTQVSKRLRRYVRVAYAPESLLDGADAPGEDGPGEEQVRARSPRGRRPGSSARWRTRPGVAVRAGAVVLLAGVLAAGWVVLRPVPDGPAVPLVDPGSTAVAATATAAAPTAGAPAPAGPDPAASTGTADAVSVVVHVAGAVERPGVVDLPTGARVQEALEAAGGPAPGADLDTLNLAALLVDGQQVYVPAEGEEPGGGASGASAAGGSAGAGAEGADGAGAADGAAGAGPVDLNLADAAALDTLPGIGPALAQRILQHREQNGPFTSVEQLSDVSGIGPTTMDRLRDLVTV